MSLALLLPEVIGFYYHCAVTKSKSTCLPWTFFHNEASQDKFTLPFGSGLCTSLASFSLVNINIEKLTQGKGT